MGWLANKAYCEAELAQEGITPPVSYLLALANDGIDQINEIYRPQAYKWTSSDFSGKTTVTNGITSLAIPSTLIGPIESITYEDEPIDQVDAQDFDMYMSGDTPVYTVQGTTLRINVASLTNLVIRARKALDRFVVTEQAPDPDPLAILPVSYHLMPGIYALSRYSASPDVPREVRRQETYRGLWEQKLMSLRTSLDARGSEPFRF